MAKLIILGVVTLALFGAMRADQDADSKAEEPNELVVYERNQINVLGFKLNSNRHDIEEAKKLLPKNQWMNKCFGSECPIIEKIINIFIKTKEDLDATVKAVNVKLQQCADAYNQKNITGSQFEKISSEFNDLANQLRSYRYQNEPFIVPSEITDDIHYFCTLMWNNVVMLKAAGFDINNLS